MSASCRGGCSSPATLRLQGDHRLEPRRVGEQEVAGVADDNARHQGRHVLDAVWGLFGQLPCRPSHNIHPNAVVQVDHGQHLTGERDHNAFQQEDHVVGNLPLALACTSRTARVNNFVHWYKASDTGKRTTTATRTLLISTVETNAQRLQRFRLNLFWQGIGSL